MKEEINTLYPEENDFEDKMYYPEELDETAELREENSALKKEVMTLRAENVVLKDKIVSLNDQITDLKNASREEVSKLGKKIIQRKENKQTPGITVRSLAGNRTGIQERMSKKKKLITVAVICVCMIVVVAGYFLVYQPAKQYYDQECETALNPFRQKYWIIFTEGYRSDRVEASTIDSGIPAGQLQIVWDTSLEINIPSGSGGCDQYYLDDNGKWVNIGDYHILSNNATHVLASNLDVVDRYGKIIVHKIPYTEIDWNAIERYR